VENSTIERLGEETGRSPRTIETAIHREQKSENTPSLTELAGTDKHRPQKIQFRRSFTGDNEWYTPIKYIEAARTGLGEIVPNPPATA